MTANSNKVHFDPRQEETTNTSFGSPQPGKGPIERADSRLRGVGDTRSNSNTTTPGGTGDHHTMGGFELICPPPEGEDSPRGRSFSRFLSVSQALLDRSTGAGITPAWDPRGAVATSTREGDEESSSHGDGLWTGQRLLGEALVDTKSPSSCSSKSATVARVGWTSFDRGASGGGHRRTRDRFHTNFPNSSQHHHQCPHRQQQRQQSGSSASHLHVRRHPLNFTTSGNGRSEESSTSAREKRRYTDAPGLARPRQLYVLGTTQDSRNRGPRTPRQHRAASAPTRRTTASRATNSAENPTINGSALRTKLWMINTTSTAVAESKDGPPSGADTTVNRAEASIFDDSINSRVLSLPARQSIKSFEEAGPSALIVGGRSGGKRRGGVGATLDHSHRIRSRTATAGATENNHRIPREKPNRVTISAMKRFSRGASCGQGIEMTGRKEGRVGRERINHDTPVPRTAR